MRQMGLMYDFFFFGRENLSSMRKQMNMQQGGEMQVEERARN